MPSIAKDYKQVKNQMPVDPVVTSHTKLNA